VGCGGARGACRQNPILSSSAFPGAPGPGSFVPRDKSATLFMSLVQSGKCRGFGGKAPKRYGSTGKPDEPDTFLARRPGGRRYRFVPPGEAPMKNGGSESQKMWQLSNNGNERTVLLVTGVALPREGCRRRICYSFGRWALFLHYLGRDRGHVPVYSTHRDQDGLLSRMANMR